MIEWSKEQEFNSFNSMKGLTYFEHYKKILFWLNKETQYLPPPIEVALDPIAECNLKCYFCVTQRYLKYHREDAGENRSISTENLLHLLTFLSGWGVKSVCFSGGGEPTLHPGLSLAIHRAHFLGLQTAMATNATNITDPLSEEILHSRWLGISVDSSNREEYLKVKGVDKFDTVIKNIEKLVYMRRMTNSKVDIAYKMLLLPENLSSIYSACKLAKKLGVQDFHVRPVDYERPDIPAHQKLPLNVELIEEQFAKCHEEETSEFRVFTVTHKFNASLHVKHDFTRCLATPLVIPILSDGNSYLCIDKKMDKAFKLGSCVPDPYAILTWWGSEEHRNLIKSVNISQCSRCTWSQYNRQIENAVLQDKMCLAFP